MKSKNKLKPLRQIQEDKGETFEEVIKELEDALSTTAEEYIPRACTALKRHNPLISSPAIRSTVLSNPVISRVWTEKTIRNYWPPWMKSPQAMEAGSKARATQLQTKQLRENATKYGLSEQDVERDEEQIPVESYTPEEYEETHPKTEESPFEAMGEINRSLARFWTALTKNKNMPTREDDVMKQYIIPARDRLKDIANGSSKIERDFLFNWLTWVIMAAKDCRNIFENADKTAYDTRENKE